MEYLLHISQHYHQLTFDIEHDIKPPFFSNFPSSSVRDHPPPQQHTPLPRPSLSHNAAPHKHYDRLRILVQQEQDAAQKPLVAHTTYSTHVPRLHHVAPGVLSDGSLTINYPAVRRFLESAETDSCVEPPSSPPLFALAALAVFYHPKKPVHWLFWSKDKREKTAAIVHKVLSESSISHTFGFLPNKNYTQTSNLRLSSHPSHGWAYQKT